MEGMMSASVCVCVSACGYKQPDTAVSVLGMMSRTHSGAYCEHSNAAQTGGLGAGLGRR